MSTVLKPFGAKAEAFAHRPPEKDHRINILWGSSTPATRKATTAAILRLNSGLPEARLKTLKSEAQGSELMIFGYSAP